MGTAAKRGRKPAPTVVVDGVDCKRCTRCKELVPLSAYPREPSGRLRARCAPCTKRTAYEAFERQRNGTAKKTGPNLKLRKERMIDGKREKWCSRGKHWVLDSEFAANSSAYDGLDRCCSPCVRTYQSAVLAKTEKRREARRRWAAGNGRAVVQAYKERWPAKKIAQTELHRAVKNGEVAKPDACSSCGGTERIEAHHDDYALPLDVRWLCRWCHRAWHRQHGPGLNADLRTG